MIACPSKHGCGLLFILLLILACAKPPEPVVAPSDFTKAQREELGLMLQNAIALNDENFTILPKSPPYDTSVYWFLQTLYDQATNVMRIDHQAPSDNHWTKSSSWPVTVLKSDTKNAFILPGGYFYITTGLLKALSEEYELYYIMTFESTLMNEGLLLRRLVSEVNGNALADLINSNASPGGDATQSLAQALSTLIFDPADVMENDQLTADAICNTSQWDRLGILPIIDTYDNDLEWLYYRPSFDDRQNYVLNMDLSAPEDCGSHKTNNATGNGYKRYVLDQLD